MSSRSLVAVIFAGAGFLISGAAEAVFVQLRATKQEQIPSTELTSRSSTSSLSTSPKCIVFHSQHKSAGHTVEMLAGWIPLQGTGLEQSTWKNERTGNCKFMCDHESWHCGKQRCVEGRRQWDDKWRAYYKCGRKYQYMAFNGYVQTLSGLPKWGRAGEGPCVWTTLSREPVARLVSALFYCKHQWATDPLCGASRLNAANATVRDWAKHWGNYLFREMLWHPDLKRLAERRSDFRRDATIDCADEPWLQFKDQLAGGDDLRTQSGRLNFRALKNHLLGRYGAKPLYDAYGVVEMWNQTMEVFDKVMPLEGKSWLVAAQTAHGDHGNTWHREEKAALQEARNDPEVLADIAADIELYHHIIVPAFKKRWGYQKILPIQNVKSKGMTAFPADASAEVPRRFPKTISVAQ